MCPRAGGRISTRLHQMMYPSSSISSHLLIKYGFISESRTSFGQPYLMKWSTLDRSLSFAVQAFSWAAVMGLQLGDQSKVQTLQEGEH